MVQNIPTSSPQLIQFHMVTNEIGRITLNQPGRRNALSSDMWDALTSALVDAAEDPDLKVLVITGAGEHFSAGADISEFSKLYATAESAKAVSQKISLALDAIAEFPRPTIAKIRGACVGGGAGIAVACDMRIADGTSKFAITPAKMGLVYPFKDVRRLVDCVGLARAKDMLLSARSFTAEAAREMGLITELVDQYELDERVRDYALKICANSKQSTKIMKQMFMDISEGQRSETQTTQQWFYDAFTSADFKEGYSAFLQKRTADF